MNGIRITLYVLLIMHILPFAITQLLVLEYPFNKRKRGIVLKLVCTAANILLNGFVLYEILKHAKFDLKELIDFTCSYQDLARLATSNVISLVLSALIGFILYIFVCECCRDERSLRFSGRRLFLFAFAAVPIILGYYFSYSGVSELVITEVCRKMTVTNSAGDVVSEVSYVTVLNNGILTCELGDVYLSDDADVLQEQQFPRNAAVQPGKTYQYRFTEGALDIKKTGETTLYLSDKFGNVADNIIVPALKQDESYKNLGTDWQIINFAREIVTVPAPVFSLEGGFYDEPFMLELTASPGTTIYYTLDSSNPTVESAEYSRAIYVYDRSSGANQYSAYTGERPVDKCFVVRAVAVDDDGNFSETITKSYFIDQDKYKDRTVISLVSDPDGLFGDNGIYVRGITYDEWYQAASANLAEGEELDTTNAPTPNYDQKGIEWERESNLEVFEDTDLLLNQPVGIRLQGGSARHLTLKRFSIYAREEYGSSDYFDVDLLGDYSLHSVYTRAGDLHAISQVIGQDRDVTTMDFIQVDVFLDGEFWYSTYLYEKFSEKNLSQKYDLFEDNIVIAKHGRAYGDRTNDDMEAGTNPLSMLATFPNANDLSIDENYWKFGEILDIQSYIDWACINSFLLNLDHDERANNIYWHTAIRENGQEGDARWRLGLYDMDLIWAYIHTGMPYYEANPFNVEEVWQNKPITTWPIYSALRRNDNFCQQFVLTFMDLINTNLSYDNIMAIMDDLGIVNAGYQEFFENRAFYVVPYMAEEFELTGTRENVTLSSNVFGTPITLNTITPELKLPAADDAEETAAPGTYSWTGSYFTDYPVTVTANDSNFSHWEVTSNGRTQIFTDRTIEVPVSTGGVQIYAVSQ